jgi:hypothetical protein
LFINLTPFKHPEKSKIFLGTRFVPLSILGEGERVFREGLRPSLTPLPLPFVREGGQGDRLLNNPIQ